MNKLLLILLSVPVLAFSSEKDENYQNYLKKFEVAKEETKKYLVNDVSGLVAEYVGQPISYEQWQKNSKELFLAVYNRSFDEVKQLIEAEPMIINIQEIQKCTPLILATMKGDLDIVKLLVENGANINLENAWRWTALDCALYALAESDIQNASRGDYVYREHSFDRMIVDEVYFPRLADNLKIYQEVADYLKNEKEFQRILKIYKDSNQSSLKTLFNESKEDIKESCTIS